MARRFAGDFDDGAAFVSLAHVRDLVLVLSATAQALGVRGTGEAPLAERLAAFLRSRSLLLVLDNVEQVAEAAPALAGLLDGCPCLKILATGRSLLRLSGERAYRVPPLTLPDPAAHPSAEAMARAEAVRLFVARAQAVQPDFSLTEASAPAVGESPAVGRSAAGD